jgi:hypothetical protein
MNDLPRRVLTRIISEHGRGICDTPKRVEALLRDLCGAHRREINIIIGALEERVAADLLAAGGTMPRDVLLARLAARLRDNLAYTPEAARWGVETWAVALGTLSEAELRERARAEAAESAGDDAPPPPPRPTIQDAEPSKAKSPRVNPQTPRVIPQTPRVHPPASQSPSGAPPARQPAQSPKGNPPPTTAASNAPAPRRTPTMPPNVPAPRPPRQNVAPAPPAQDTSRRSLTLRGCFIVFVLLIVLIVAAVFVVPAVIMILKEEQARPSINDPQFR